MTFWLNDISYIPLLSILEITTLKDYLQTIMVNGVNSALSINDAINKSLQDSN